jgi:hypothetical protein
METIASQALSDRAITIIAMAVARTNPDEAWKIVSRVGIVQVDKARREVALSIASRYPLKALELAPSIEEKLDQENVMEAIVISLAATELERAEKLALDGGDPARRAVLLARMARSVVVTQPEEATRLCLEAARLAHASKDKFCVQRVSAILVGIMALTDLEKSVQMADRLANNKELPELRTEIARMVAQSDPDRALPIALDSADSASRAEVLVEIAHQAIQRGASGRTTAERAVIALLSGVHWAGAFDPLSHIDADALNVGLSAILRESEFTASETTENPSTGN